MRLSGDYNEVVFTDTNEYEYFYQLCRLTNALPSVDDTWAYLGATYVHLSHIRPNLRLYRIADASFGKKSKFMQDLEKLIDWAECQ